MSVSHAELGCGWVGGSHVGWGCGYVGGSQIGVCCVLYVFQEVLQEEDRSGCEWREGVEGLHAVTSSGGMC